MFPVTVVPVIVKASSPQRSHGGESSINRFPIMHDNSARVQAYLFNIRYAVSSRSIRPLL